MVQEERQRRTSFEKGASMRKEETNTISYPSQEEILAAQRVCCGAACAACESPVEYAWRRRDIDIAVLLHLAIERELLPAQRELVVRHWLEGESIGALAEQQGVTPGSITHQLKTSLKRLHRALYYVVQYQQNLQEAEAPTSLSVQRAKAVLAAQCCACKDFSARLQNQRIASNLPVAYAAEALGISAKRLTALEEGAQEPTLREAVTLAAFYGIDLNEYMKGSDNGNANSKPKGKLAYGAFQAVRPCGAAAERGDCGNAQTLSSAAG